MFTLPFPYLFESVGREKNIADREQKQLIGKLIRFATPHSLLRSKNFKKIVPNLFLCKTIIQVIFVKNLLDKIETLEFLN